MSSAKEMETASAESIDDFVLPFSTVNSGMIGRIVRLGPLANTVLGRHNHPQVVSEVLGQTLVLAALLGSALKFKGGLIVQLQTDGPVRLVVANYETPGRLRGYAGFDAERVSAFDGHQGPVDPADIIGIGHLALTIDQGEAMDRYQGVVSLGKGGVVEAAQNYFRQSEQLPTFLRLAVARHRIPRAQNSGDDANKDGWQWRASGLLLQHVSPVGGTSQEYHGGGELEQDFLGEDDDHWRRVETLAATVEDHELLDPTLSAERLLYRLFHEEGVRVSAGTELDDFCRCSRERVATFLKTFQDDNISDLLDDDGKVTITCEFCSTSYQFDPEPNK